MTGLLYEEDAFGVFILVTFILGGGAAWLTGRAAAQTWRPIWQVVVYSLMLGGAVRFIHFSLFSGTLLSLHFYAVDTIICIAFGLIGVRVARVAQMVRQYGWMNESSGPFRWRRKTP